MTNWKGAVNVFKQHLTSRKEWEEQQGHKPCPYCPHMIRDHCTRNIREDTNAPCCPGYCFADDECPCPGYESTPTERAEQAKRVEPEIPTGGQA